MLIIMVYQYTFEIADIYFVLSEEISIYFFSVPSFLNIISWLL